MKHKTYRLKLNPSIHKTRKTKLNPLRTVYGEILLKKGTLLYHTSSEPFEYNSEKPMLFLTFHPSEWIHSSTKYLTKFILNRDVSLLFMIKVIKTSRIISVLDTLIQGSNLAKQDDNKLKCFIPYLKSAKFDGWFSTIEGGMPVEIALINESATFSKVETNRIIRDWKNGNYKNYADLNSYIPKYWGDAYTISLYTLPAQLKINRIYEPMIDKFMKYVKEEDPDGNILYILLKTAKIRYIDAPYTNIYWKC